MAGSEPFAAVLSVLRSCYDVAVPLETFVQDLGDSGAGRAEVLRAGDHPAYRTFVRQCLVCVPPGARAIPRPFTFQQLSSQNEVTTRIVQRLCEKGKKNILAYGYSLPDEHSSKFAVMPFSKIHSYLPNSVTENLRFSNFWETLLSRIGDDVMMYLLEHCAVFMLVPPSNCYQVCGQPVYELVSPNGDSPMVFVKQECSKQKRTGLVRYMQKRLKFHRNYLFRSYRWKCRQRCEVNVPRMRNESITKMRSLVRSEKQSSSSSCVSATAPSLKRKIHGEQPEIPGERAKMGEKVREEKACNLTPDVNQSNSERSETGCVAPRFESLTKTPHISQRSNSTVSGPLDCASCGRKKFVSGKSSLVQRVQSNKPSESNSEMRAESCRKEVEMHTSKSELASVQTKPMEGISSECRRQETPQPHLSKELPHRLLDSAVCIEKKSVLYSRGSFREGFHISFLLNCLSKTETGGIELVKVIFLSQNVQQSTEEQQNQSLPNLKRRQRLPRRYWQMRHIFQKLLKNHSECPYIDLLRKNCPVSISENTTKTIKLCCQEALPGGAEVHKQAEQLRKEPAECVTSSGCESGHTAVPDNLGAPLAEALRGELQSKVQNPQEASVSALKMLLKQHSTHRQVYLFVRDCLHMVIPAELWGSCHNMCWFLTNVKLFISMGKLGNISLQELMSRMRVNDCLWLRLNEGTSYIKELSARKSSPPYSESRSFFYITETTFQKNMLFYYRKFVWSKLQDIGIRNHFDKVQLQPLSSKDIESISKQKIVPVASKLRFIPKRNGLRPVVKVSGIVEARALSKESRQKKMNHYTSQLKSLFSVLNYERTVNTSFLGSSVFGKDDIYKVWKQFVRKVLASGGEIPHFYCVKADVSRAFDTIPHNKLVEVISRVMKPEKKTQYCIRRYAVIMVTPSGKPRKIYRRHVSTFKDFIPDMKQFVSHLNAKDSLQNAIVVEQSLTFNETSSSMFKFFLQVIRNTILKIRNRYYLQCCGIPQGFILSSLLCNLFYGDMENKLFSGIQQDGVLIRLIDDFLLLTPDLMKARTFVRTLAAGIPEYGLLINQKKTVVNFPLDGIPKCSKFKQLPDCRLVPWCGLLLDIKTLQVYCDYSSYSYTSITSSLTFNSSTTPGENMKYKLNAVLKLKCHGLFLDLQINSLRTVLINIYKILLLQACRFHACVTQLPFNRQMTSNPGFFLTLISQTARCCYAILKEINAGIGLKNPGAAEWLCYHAFLLKLKNHSVIYKFLLLPLSRCNQCIPKNIVKLLQAVTEPAICQDFKTVLD
uniref:Telomerase reverse transcriptase n=1 Tax=Malurus cyaneus samueli TaxID=2593467 RepID=A0A8C5T0G0_9PASS